MRSMSGFLRSAGLVATRARSDTPWREAMRESVSPDATTIVHSSAAARAGRGVPTPRHPIRNPIHTAARMPRTSGMDRRRPASPSGPPIPIVEPAKPSARNALERISSLWSGARNPMTDEALQDRLKLVRAEVDVFADSTIEHGSGDGAPRRRPFELGEHVQDDPLGAGQAVAHVRELAVHGPIVTRCATSMR